MDQKQVTVGDRNGSGRARFTFFPQFERDMYFSLRDRAHQLEDKVRFGLVALNAGSILALIASSSKDGLASSLHLPTTSLGTAVLCFLGGVAAVGWSLWLQKSHDILQAAGAYDRLMRATSAMTSLELPDSPEARKMHQDAVDVYQSAPMVGFRASNWVNWLQALSMGCWFGGVISIIRPILHI